MAKSREKKRKLGEDAAVIDAPFKRVKKSKQVGNTRKVGIKESMTTAHIRSEEDNTNGPQAQDQHPSNNPGSRVRMSKKSVRNGDMPAEKLSQLHGIISPNGKKSSAAQKHDKLNQNTGRHANESQITLTDVAGLRPNSTFARGSGPTNKKGNSKVPSDGPGILTQAVEETGRIWRVSPRTGGAFINQDPIFVRDGNGMECIISATRHRVMLMSLETSWVIQSHVVPDERKVASICLKATKDNILLIAYDNGEVIEWNWNTSMIAQTESSIEDEVISMATLSDQDGTLSTACIVRKENKYCISRDAVTLFETENQINDFKLIDGGMHILALSPQSFIIGSRNDITDHENSSRSPTEYRWVELPSLTYSFTCFDARLVEDVATSEKSESRSLKLTVAIGNSCGQILLYPDVLSLFSARVALPTPRRIHWHQFPVLTARFSKDGNDLITGGEESVLIFEQLQTGQRTFLPRLASTIERVAVNPDGTRYALKLGNNSIVVISSTERKAVAYFQGLNIVQESPSNSDARMHKIASILHPNNSQHLLLITSTSKSRSPTEQTPRQHLQTYDISNSSHVRQEKLADTSSLDGLIGPERDSNSASDIHLVAISHDGQWLSTLEEWMPASSTLQHRMHPDDVLRARREQRETTLNFWSWHTKKQSWQLNTRIRCPHHSHKNALGAGDGRVFKLIADPSDTAFLTIGEDGQMKVWRPKARKRHGIPVVDQDNQPVMKWVQRYEVSFAIPRSLPPQKRIGSPKADGAALAISRDGTLIAAALTCYDRKGKPFNRPQICLVNGFEGRIQSEMVPWSCPEQSLVEMAIMHRHLILLTPQTVRLWDLVGEKMAYSVTLPKSENPNDMMLTVNEESRTFAVLCGPSGERQIQVFGPRQRLFVAKFADMPMAILSGQSTVGYKVLFSDSTIRTILPGVSELDGTGEKSDNINSSHDLSIIEREDEDDDGEMSSPSLGDAEMAIEEIDDNTTPAEDDRPVVTSQQVKDLFDPGPGQPQPTMKEMFEGVVELFARKPYSVRNANRMYED